MLRFSKCGLLLAGLHHDAYISWRELCLWPILAARWFPVVFRIYVTFGRPTSRFAIVLSQKNTPWARSAPFAFGGFVAARVF